MIGGWIDCLREKKSGKGDCGESQFVVVVGMSIEWLWFMVDKEERQFCYVINMQYVFIDIYNIQKEYSKVLKKFLLNIIKMVYFFILIYLFYEILQFNFLFIMNV